MPNKTLYVRAHDERIWEVAARSARRRRMSLSAFVTSALEQYLTGSNQQRGYRDATNR